MESRPAAKARLRQVNLVVADMERTLAFYQLLGVEMAPVGDEWQDWAPHHQQIAEPGSAVPLEFDSAASVVNWAPAWESDRNGALIGLDVDSDEDVDAAVAAVAEAGHTVLQPPHVTFFGARYAVVADPDGNAVGIMGPSDPARRWDPELPV